MTKRIETLPGGTTVFTAPGYAITTDSLLLADFCGAKPSFSVCDLGCGCGILLLCLADAGLRGPAVGVEINEDALSLFQDSIAENAFSNIQAVPGNLCEYRSPFPFDCVVANPPYFDAGAEARLPQRATARHEITATLEDFCVAASRLLKDGGRFCLCYPPARLAQLMHLLGQHGLAAKRLQLVRKSPNDAPWLALLDARKAGGVGLSILPDKLLPAGRPVTY